MEFGDKSLTEFYKHLHISLRFVFLLHWNQRVLIKIYHKVKKWRYQRGIEKHYRQNNDHQNSTKKKKYEKHKPHKHGGTEIIRKGRQLMLH